MVFYTNYVSVRVFIIITFFLIIVSSSFPVKANSENQIIDTIEIGVSSRTLEFAKMNEATAALKAWAASITKELQFKKEVEAKVYNQFETIKEDFFNNRLEAITITAEELMNMGITPEYVIMPLRDQDYFINYAIIIRNNRGIDNIYELKGLKLVMHESQLMILAMPWLETIMYGYTKGNTESWFGEIRSIIGNPSKAILEVYFGQVDAALVNINSFKLACELNPQLNKELKVLSISPRIITSLMILNPNFKGNARKQVEDGILGFSRTASGKQLLMVYQSSNMVKMPISALNETIQLIKEYRSLFPDVK